MCVKDGIPSAKYKEQYFSISRALRSNGDAVHAFVLNLCGVNGATIHSLLRERVGLN
jgi:hypothetical protein